MYSIYILKCSDNSYYVGYTSDLTRRMEEHMSESGSTHTKIWAPVELVYKENVKSEYEAKNREKQIKGWSRKKKNGIKYICKWLNGSLSFNVICYMK